MQGRPHEQHANTQNRIRPSGSSTTCSSSYSTPTVVVEGENDDEQQERLPLLSNDPQATMSHIFGMPLWTAAAATISCIGGFLFGFDLGVVGGLFIAPSFQSHFGIDPDDKIKEADIQGNIVAVLQIGCLVGSLAASLVADKLGRRISIILGTIVFIVGGTLQIVGEKLAMLYAGRLIAGLGRCVGALSMLVPIYVSEIAHQKHRGILGGLWQFFISAGLALSYWTNYAVQRTIPNTDDALWRIPLIVQTAPSVLILVGILFLFETPRCLCAHNKISEARAVIAKVNGWPQHDPRVEEEIEIILSSLTPDPTAVPSASASSWRIVLGASNRKRLLMGCALQVFQQLTGTNVINYYSPIIFRSIGLSSATAELFATGVYGLVKMTVGLIGFSCLVDRLGRRPLLCGGGAAMGLCMIAVAICVGTRAPAGSDQMDPSALTGILFMYAFAICFVLSWGPIPWIYCSEIYPTRSRAKSTSITTAVNWVFNAVVGKFSPILLASSTVGAYVFFGGWCFVMSAFCFFFLPETKGKSLEEIDQLLGNTKGRVSDVEHLAQPPVSHGPKHRKASE
ncbi:general substrate transporter [Syncephalastrum racemosum]|uniref:General substrate transporter n=1 Tax=Syncephalastrum racemosum TaxID=13706 RepID=A0A1X2GZ59_SYNRA|nr:general substrate transporter [Syncephalastrum racemosum]